MSSLVSYFVKDSKTGCPTKSAARILYVPSQPSPAMKDSSCGFFGTACRECEAFFKLRWHTDERRNKTLENLMSYLASTQKFYVDSQASSSNEESNKQNVVLVICRRALNMFIYQTKWKRAIGKVVTKYMQTVSSGQVRSCAVTEVLQPGLLIVSAELQCGQLAGCQQFPTTMY